ncbi:hypothetical protein [Allosphingosinicella sp.]|jgi:hypothetical protein|uniref:hypothetical protein n=1 Tax=Allosphingosinicella sp. TaxID=2823234 RepID=UPI002F00632E
MADDESVRESTPARVERGRRASFDCKTGEVHGSGSGSGGEGNPREDYDQDPMAGAGAELHKGPRGDSEKGA